MIAEHREELLVYFPAKDPGRSKCPADGEHGRRTAEHHPPCAAESEVAEKDHREIFYGREQTKAYSGQEGPSLEICVVAKNARQRDHDVRLAEEQVVDQLRARQQDEYRGLGRSASTKGFPGIMQPRSRRSETAGLHTHEQSRARHRAAPIEPVEPGARRSAGGMARTIPQRACLSDSGAFGPGTTGCRTSVRRCPRPPRSWRWSNSSENPCPLPTAAECRIPRIVRSTLSRTANSRICDRSLNEQMHCNPALLEP